jgi:hypothetical protein
MSRFVVYYYMYVSIRIIYYVISPNTCPRYQYALDAVPIMDGSIAFMREIKVDLPCRKMMYYYPPAPHWETFYMRQGEPR